MSRCWLRLRAVSAALCAALTVLSAPALARQSTQDDPRPSFTAEIGLGQMVKMGAWCPVRVQITGGSAPADGVVRVEIGRGMATDMTVEAPFGATPKKTTFVDVCVPIVEDSSRRPDERWMRVALVDRSGKTLRTARYSEDGRNDSIRFFSKFVNGDGHLMVYVGRSTLRIASQTWSMGYERFKGLSQITVTGALASSLPTKAMAFEGVDTLVIVQSEFASLDTVQQQAIAEWVSVGGRLMFVADSANPDLSWLDGGAPVRVERDRVSGRPRLSLTKSGARRGWTVATIRAPDFAEEVTSTEPLIFEAPQSVPPDASSDRGIDAMAYGISGLGWVMILADDPGDIYPWGEKASVWREALEPMIDSKKLAPDDEYAWFSTSRRVASMNAIVNAVADGMGLDTRFPVLVFAAILTVLAVLVGPMDRIVLRRLRLSGLAWLSALVWIGLVGVIAYLGPNFLRTSSSVQSRVTVTDINAIDGVASRSGVLSFFAGRSGVRTIEGAAPDSWWRSASATRSDWDARPVGALSVNAVQGVGSTPGGVYMGVWTLNAMTDECRLTPEYSGRLVASGGSAVSLELEGVPSDAEQVMVIWGKRVYAATHAGESRWTLGSRNESLAQTYGVTRTELDEWGRQSRRYYGSVSDAAFMLPGADRRGEALTRAAASEGVALVYLTLPSAESDVAFHLGRVTEASRSIATRLVRMLIPVEAEGGS